MLIGEAQKPETPNNVCKSTGHIVGPGEWRCTLKRPGRETWMRVNPATHDIEIQELWLNEMPLHQAKLERELYELSADKDMKPQVVIPQSVVSQAIKDGWYHDEDKWRRWINDSDNSYLRVTRGNV